MHKTKTRLYALALAAFMCVSLALGGALAYGAWGSGSNSITFDLANNEYAEEVSTADVQVDVYKVATANKNESYETYDYVLDEPFASDKVIPGLFNSDWPEFARQAKAVITEQKVEPVRSNVPVTGESAQVVTGLPDGLYVVLPHGSDGADQPAYSDLHTYTFAPSLVALPTKAAVDGVVSSGNAGDWLNEATVVLKPEQGPLYGPLVINKTVNNFSGDPATFVFHIYGTMTEGTGDAAKTITYDNYASITYDGTSESATTTVTHIPAGMTVTVDESYDGARYALSASDTASKQVGPIVSQRRVDAGATAVSVSYENDRDTTITGGNGIENNFTYDPDNAAKGDNGWVWTAKPSAQATRGTDA